MKDSLKALMELPRSSESIGLDAVMNQLRSTGKQTFTRSDIMREIKRAGLRPWKAFNRITGISGSLEFVGTCSTDGHFIIK